MARGRAGLFAVAAAALPFQSKVKRNSKLRMHSTRRADHWDPADGSKLMELIADLSGGDACWRGR